MLYIFLDGKEYAQADSMWHAEQILDELCEEFENLEYTDPECGCIYAETNVEGEQSEAEESFSNEVLMYVDEAMSRVFYGESPVTILWNEVTGTVTHMVANPERFEVGMQLPADPQGTEWKVVSVNRTAGEIAIAPVSNAVFGGFSGSSTPVAPPAPPGYKSSYVYGLSTSAILFQHGGEVRPQDVIAVGEKFILVWNDKLVGSVELTSIDQSSWHGGPVLVFTAPDRIYRMDSQDIYGKLYYQPRKAIPSCTHEYVDVGFMHSKIACKFCGEEK